MNEIKIDVSFENGTCDISGINLVSGDYNSTKCVFTFDKENGTKIFKMKNPNDETVFEREIVNNEIILTGYDENEEEASLFNSAGDYLFEVKLYDNDGRLTSSKGVISVEEELVKEDDKDIVVYKPLFDQIIEQLDDALQEVNNLDIDANKVDTTTTITITKKDGTQETVVILDGQKGDDGQAGQDGITPNIQVGNTTTLPAGSNATVTQRGTQTNPIFDFGIPKGEDGAGGSVTSVNGQTGDVVINIPDVSNFITKDVNNLTYYTLATNTGSSIEMSINSSTYVVTLSLKNSAGTILNTQTIDLPLESVVVNGSYDSTNKKIVLTLQNGNTIDVPVGDLVSGLQTEITSSNKLSADLVDDTNTANKFTNATEKSTWSAKYDKPSGGIPSTDLSSAVQTSLGKADTALQSETYTGTITSVKMNGTTISSSGEADLGTVITDISGKQDALVSGTNIKTINNTSLLGSGDITISAAPDVDNSTITLNASNQIQTVGVIDNNSGNTDKVWAGTLAQYNTLISGGTIDSNTFYYITDDDTTSTLRQKVEVITSEDTSYTIANLTANKSYKLSELTALTITTCEMFDEESVIYFDSGSTATVLSLPNDVVQIGDTEIEADKSYIISVLNKIAVIKAYEVE